MFLNHRFIRGLGHNGFGFSNKFFFQTLSNGSADAFPIAIVGTGPSGFYTAKYLLDQDPRIKVDFYEKLPTPYGLVRYGVAPDHPEVKIVIKTFEEVMEKNSDRVRLFSNVEVSDLLTKTYKNTIPLAILREHYSAIVLAYGADSDNPLHIPGSEHPGVLTAHEFVNWYNGHPDFATLLASKNLDLSQVKEVIVVGQGNVALDVARILAKNIDRDLYSTDIARNAVNELRRSSIEKITVIGRRGHMQAAFTIKELRELTKIDNVVVKVHQDELISGTTESTLKELENNRPKRRIAELIQQIAENRTEELSKNGKGMEKKRVIDIRFLLAPKALVMDPTTLKIKNLIVNRTRLEGDAFHQKAVSTGEDLELGCDLLLSSIGYKSSSISDDIPFDKKKNIISNSRGRVMYNEGSVVKGVYVTGWLKRGPIGIIGSNITDAKETSSCVIEDINNQSLHGKSSSDDPLLKIMATGSGLKAVFDSTLSWKEVQRLHQVEIQNGQSQLPPRIREKIVDTSEMIAVGKNVK